MKRVRIIIVDGGVHSIGCALGCLSLMDVDIIGAKKEEIPSIAFLDEELKLPQLDVEFKILDKDAFAGWPIIDKPTKDWEYRRVNNWKLKRRRAR